MYKVELCDSWEHGEEDTVKKAMFSLSGLEFLILTRAILAL
jgi:hypothetical protein